MGSKTQNNRGSSPHTRGAPGRTRPGPAVGRIIPAYAGSTDRVDGAREEWRDHPRIRGEHSCSIVLSYVVVGSSPHTRGARRFPCCLAFQFRIIPAYAGSTPSGTSLRETSRDHPRIRGEHSNAALYGRSWSGSSPHTRGAPARPSHKAAVPGIIPAYAGSTRKTPSTHSPQQDHPRIRGEHGARWTPSRDHPGSSPHTRGAPTRGFLGVLPGRIIPAYAGSTKTFPSNHTRVSDHPRIRGEHSCLLSVRGLVRGIIPAYAGSTSRPRTGSG